MEKKLRDAFIPSELQLNDQSHLHAGHGGAHPDGESHFSLEIISASFEGKSRVERQRMIYDVLAAELGGRVHALAIRAQAPSEIADRD